MKTLAELYCVFHVEETLPGISKVLEMYSCRQKPHLRWVSGLTKQHSQPQSTTLRNIGHRRRRDGLPICDASGIPSKPVQVCCVLDSLAHSSHCRCPESYHSCRASVFRVSVTCDVMFDCSDGYLCYRLSRLSPQAVILSLRRPGELVSACSGVKNG